MLREDEVSVLRRRGAIDMIRPKKRWRKSLRLLVNWVPRRGNIGGGLLDIPTLT